MVPVRRLLAVLLVGLWSAGVGAQGTILLVGETRFAAGRYGTDRAVSTLSVSAGAVVTTGRWRWWATVPIVFQDAGSVRTIGGGMVPVDSALIARSGGGSGGMMGGGSGGGAGMAESGTGMISNAGIGDPLLRLDMTLWGAPGGARALSLFTAVKVPLARPSDGFGSGRWDEAIGASVVQHRGALSLFVDAAYWNVGRVAEEPYRDAVVGAVTLARTLRGERQRIFSSFVATTPFAQGLDGSRQLGLGWIGMAPDGRALSVSATVGLSAAAPATTIVLGWQWRRR